MATLEQRIEAIIKLRDYLIQSVSGLEEIIELSAQHNPWFTTNSLSKAFAGIISMLETDKLKKWVSSYQNNNSSPKRIGIIMAGNIPMVGFHDLLCVLISGNQAVVKLSTQDAHLIPYITNKLIEFEPGLKGFFTFVDKLENIDAIIATGSDNTARYFEHYFSKYPNIIRKNRTSIALLIGNETLEDFNLLGNDIFQYYGLGCRNISKLFVPENYDFTSFFEGIEFHSEIINHHKYRNNYDYNKSIYLVNGVSHLDNGFLLLTENSQLVSPISVLFYETYSSSDVIKSRLTEEKEKIQCVACLDKNQTNSVLFGETQQPELWDYADNIDSMKFLISLNK